LLASRGIQGKLKLVVRSFTACGISNNLGGSEDLLVQAWTKREEACDSDNKTNNLNYCDDDDTPLAMLIAQELESMTQSQTYLSI